MDSLSSVARALSFRALPARLEWLSSSNMLRQIYDLSNLEKDEVNVSMSGGLTPPPKERTTLNL
eukprot:1145929-Pelagomonas_calceolata.AAC.3